MREVIPSFYTSKSRICDAAYIKQAVEHVKEQDQTCPMEPHAACHQSDEFYMHNVHTSLTG